MEKISRGQARSRRKVSVQIRAERRLIVSERYLKGELQSQIADSIGVSRSVVGKDLAAIRKKWQEQSIRNMDEVMTKELERIDLIERAAWDGWLRSVNDKRSLTTRIVTKYEEDGTESLNPPIETTTKVEPQSGDHSFLSTAHKCVEQRRKMLGIDAPVKSEVTSNINYAEMSAQELDEEEKKIMKLEYKVVKEGKRRKKDE